MLPEGSVTDLERLGPQMAFAWGSPFESNLGNKNLGTSISVLL